VHGKGHCWLTSQIDKGIVVNYLNGLGKGAPDPHAQQNTSWARDLLFPMSVTPLAG